MNNDHVHQGGGALFELILALPFVLALGLYVLAAFVSGRRHDPWPLYRYFFWFCSVLSAAAVVVGPLANRSHIDFTFVQVHLCSTACRRTCVQAEIGGMLMYYGGDIIDLVLIAILCFQWYRAVRPRADQRTNSFTKVYR